jgi:hypothetical protein
MGKGSTRRKPQVNEKTFESNWDSIFGKKDEKPELCPDCGKPNKDVIHTCSPQLKETK